MDLPTYTMGFAQVEYVDGQWWLIVFTMACRRAHPELKEQRIPYASPRTAKKHLEAWVRANWPMIKRRFGLYTPPVIGNSS
ncbi:hypothetical protein [Rhodanobacter sp. L36]|uniref:hypothetical protein n=1 Tax=Rhodanobacter sp. L36 TaxID=1747221 RepID=UPI001C202865|nr:hypothetical protein [Rhodanobacter sp. L36]